MPISVPVLIELLSGAEEEEAAGSLLSEGEGEIETDWLELVCIVEPDLLLEGENKDEGFEENVVAAAESLVKPFAVARELSAAAESVLIQVTLPPRLAGRDMILSRGDVSLKATRREPSSGHQHGAGLVTVAGLFGCEQATHSFDVPLQ
jgi:hypothetical protein